MSQPEVDTLDAYRREFEAPLRTSSDYPKDSRLAKAYEIALDIRKFEIELYWKRAGYFWLLLAALATALGLVMTGGSKDLLSAQARETIGLFVSCAACVLSTCWMVVNRASKGWQRNWELQVDVLEEAVLGPLYKTVMFKGSDSRNQVRFSISDANFWMSTYFLLMFAVCAFYFSGLGRGGGLDAAKLSIVLGNLVFIGIFFANSRTMQDPSKLRVVLSYTRRVLRPGVRIDAPAAPPPD